MTADTVSAEVRPAAPEQARAAAKALQERGFRVLGVGAWISVDASVDLWREVFGASFTRRTSTTLPDAERQATYLEAEPGSVTVPHALEGLIAEVEFVPPPQLH